MMRPLIRPIASTCFQPGLLSHRRSLLHLPPESRTFLLRQRAAPFNASAIRHEPILSPEALNVAEGICYAAIQYLHATSGFPWAYVIPASAVAMRLLIFPIALSNRKAQQRFVNIQPLLQAWLVKFKHVVSYNHARAQDSAFLRRELAAKMRKKKADLISSWKCGFWRRQSATFIQIPIFLSIAEAYRRMTGFPQGWISAIINNAVPSWVSERITPYLENSFSGGPNAGSIFDPTLSTEGMLWILELDVPDPTGSLSGIVVGLNLLNMYIGSRRSNLRTRGRSRLDSIRRVMQGSVISVMLLIYPLTLNMPAAVMLYWASSTSTLLLSNAIMDLRWPLRKPPMACKREVRIPMSMKNS